MDDNYLTHFSQSLEILNQYAGVQLLLSSENEKEFSVNVNSETPYGLLSRLVEFQPCLDIFEIQIDCNFQQVSCRYLLTQDIRIECSEWAVDYAITPPQLNERGGELLEELSNRLSKIGESTLLNRFTELITNYCMFDESLNLSINIHIDKKKVIRNLNLGENINCLIYIISDKFKESINNKYFWEIENILGGASQNKNLVFLADVTGIAKSQYITLIGRDKWNPSDYYLHLDKNEFTLITDAIKFRSEEVVWDFGTSYLTPYLFYLSEKKLSDIELVNKIDAFCVQACISYLSTHVRLDDDHKLIGEFLGFRKHIICLSADKRFEKSDSLFLLFKWSYENTSSDKLNLVRQVISYSFSEDPENNLTTILDKAADFLTISVNNFQYYLRRNVEEYFEKRLKVFEYLQKFTKETSEAITKITSDLVGDLYKTIGVILGVLITALIDPNVIPTVIHWASFSYIIYILIIILYSLSLVYFKFYNSVKSLDINLKEQSIILTKIELSMIKGKQYKDSVWLFRIYFLITEILYAILGIIAYSISTIKF